MSVAASPYGTVEVLHAGPNLKVWRIEKDAEEVDPHLTSFPWEDFLFVVEGALKLEFADGEVVVLEAGDWYVIPAGSEFRGYRWPRDGGRCTFLAVTPA
jgi:mannose-6-phosphate isomerase-like protein (cupin superfamily)